MEPSATAPWAEAKKKENFEKRLTRPIDLKTNETTGDPEAKCYLPGVPRATYMPYPFQIIQTPKQILLAFLLVAVVVIGFSYMLPVQIALAAPFSGLIFGFALWEAWKANRGFQLSFNGPFRVSTKDVSGPEPEVERDGG